MEHEAVAFANRMVTAVCYESLLMVGVTALCLALALKYGLVSMSLAELKTNVRCIDGNGSN